MSFISPLGNPNANGYGYTPSTQEKGGAGPASGPTSPIPEGDTKTGAVKGKEKIGARGIEEEGKRECQTCKNRKYKDISDEMVSFKSPAQMDPGEAGAKVRAHEQEHVSNACSRAAEGNGKVVSASVAIHMGICPECGKAYVSGGTTRTQIKYGNEKNPYEQDKKARDYAVIGGKNYDKAV
jgi:hypothetical protein